jgi:hypothetical protein
MTWGKGVARRKVTTTITTTNIMRDERENVQEIIFGGQLLGGRIKCLWNEVPHASKASSTGKLDSRFDSTQQVL